MGSKRSPQDDFPAANSDLKRSKMTLAEEEVVVILNDFELEEEGGEINEEARLEDGGLVEPTITDDPVIFLLHICFLCDMELDCAPGDLVMKTHYISHFSPGSLLGMVGHDVGEKLRCPYAECHNMGEEMLLQQLNLHLELAHNKLRMLLERERDTSPVMSEVLSIMYDFDNYRAMKYKKNSDIDEERTDPTWTPHVDDFNDDGKNDPGDREVEEEGQNDPDPSQTPNVYQSNLKTHNEQKSNKCKHCDFASIRANNLKTHMKTHSGEKSNRPNDTNVRLQTSICPYFRTFPLFVQFCGRPCFLGPICPTGALESF